MGSLALLCAKWRRWGYKRCGRVECVDCGVREVGVMKKGVGFQGAFGVMVFWSLVLTVLKLAGVVGWSWWWVLAPLWVGVLVVVGLLFALLVLK